MLCIHRQYFHSQIHNDNTNAEQALEIEFENKNKVHQIDMKMEREIEKQERITHTLYTRK